MQECNSFDVSSIRMFTCALVVMLSYVTPVACSLIWVVLLDESITWGMVMGLCFIILGVSIIYSIGRQRATLPYA